LKERGNKIHLVSSFYCLLLVASKFLLHRGTIAIMPTQPLTVILTHEHADFDALASLLGAHKLFPAAIPLLPRSLNRNLLDFLALHRSALPFRQSDDLPRRAVERAIVVDAQSFATVRGMQPNTPALIIDHHALQRALPEGWEFWGDEVGATTTLLVERIAERGLPLTPVEATLLLLGIYEDTGSLLYAATTARDLRTAAWLLEQGANLAVAHGFLHHPLSAAQSELYTRLAENSRIHIIAGQPVMIATAQAAGYRDEISPLAHALRDVYDPTVLLLLVDLEDRIQLVARSNSDALDVGELARTWGGGGHPRAAAALIRGNTLEEVQTQLLAQLQSAVQAPVTVAQIMTHGNPIVVPPSLSVAEMAKMIRQYGFEGYPVLAQAERPMREQRYAVADLLGIITRRQVDRALQHDLGNHPIERYMRTGQVTVSPHTSVPALQRLMIETGWGQIPVVDAASGQISGIVTRTDLIKLWGTAPSVSRREEIARRMAATLPPPLMEHLHAAGEIAETLGYLLYAVGGFARDLLLRRPNFDVDLVVEGNAIELAERMTAAFGGYVHSHERFGTAKWLLPERHAATHGEMPTALPASLDFVSARAEFYTAPTVLPTVESGSIKLDLHRRDFTINTLAIALNKSNWGELLDFYGGERDLHAGVLRVLHTHSFVDDPTRILRAARFAQRFGFSIETRTGELIANSIALLDRVTPARIRHELELIFGEQQPERALRHLQEMGVLAMLHADLRVTPWVEERFATLRRTIHTHQAVLPADLDQLYFGIWTYGLEPADFAQLNQRLSLMSSTMALLHDLHRCRGYLAELEQSDLRSSRIFALLQPVAEAARFLLPIITASPVIAERVQRFEEVLRPLQLYTNGHTLQRMGLKPGPRYGKILDALRTARLDGEISSEAEEQALLQQLIRTDS